MIHITRLYMIIKRTSSVLAGGFAKPIPEVLSYRHLTLFSNKELPRELRSSLHLEIRVRMIVEMVPLESIPLQAIHMLQALGAPICNCTQARMAASLYGQIQMIHNAAP